MMKKIKKKLVIATMMVMLICSCMPVAAATDGVNGCVHNEEDIRVYDKILQYREFLYTHTEHNGTSTVTCKVYRDHYVVRYICNACGNIVTTINESKEVHINQLSNLIVSFVVNEKFLIW